MFHCSSSSDHAAFAIHLRVFSDASGRFDRSVVDVGGTIGPILFGFMLDHAMGRHVFLAVAAFFAIAIVTVVQVRRVRPAHA